MTTTTVVLIVLGVAAILAGPYAAVVVAVALTALGEWSDRASVAP